jgi:hypothetical protein
MMHGFKLRAEIGKIKGRDFEAVATGPIVAW